jgi:hypothetical protein
MASAGAMGAEAFTGAVTGAAEVDSSDAAASTADAAVSTADAAASTAGAAASADAAALAADAVALAAGVDSTVVVEAGSTAAAVAMVAATGN